jgi:outer membrane biosynthesis protein TonB
MSVEDLAKQAADSVRAVIEEAQKQANEIVAAAEAEAREIRERAEAEARERIDRAREALDELGGRLGISGVVQPGTGPEPPKPPPVVPDPVPEGPPPTAAAVPDPVPAAPEPEPAPELVEPSSDPAPVQAPAGSKSGDAQAARLVALKLALDGVSKDEARAQLAAEYDVTDLDSLLGDVYAKAGK